MSKIDQLEREFSEAEIAAITQRGSKAVQGALDKLFADQSHNENKVVNRRWDSIRSMITLVDDRVRYWDGRRTQFLQIAAALLAGSIVGLVNILPRIPEIASLDKFQSFIYIPVACAATCLFVGSIRLLFIWNKQNNPNYPFSKGYRVWRWHYRHAEKSPLDTDIDRYSSATFNEEVQKFADNLTNYKLRTIEASPKELFDQDLTQLYLLLINEKFKVKFVNKLRNSLFRSLLFSLIALLLALGIMIWIRVKLYGYLFVQ